MLGEARHAGLEPETSLCPALIMKFSERALMCAVYEMFFPVPLIQDVTQGNPELKNSVWYNLNIINLAMIN